MGSYHTYHVVIEPGERDADQVAAEVRGALPAALDAALHEETDVEEAYHGDGVDVWVEDGRVHYATGRNFVVFTFDWQDLVPALDVPARWACAVWQQEVEYNGGAELFGWVDGGFRLVDDQGGRFGCAGTDALAYVERQWGVEGSLQRDATEDQQYDPDDPVAGPIPAGDAPGFEPVDRDALPDLETALEALADDDPDRRRTTAEQLYVLVSERDRAPGLDRRLFAALDDEATRWGAGATGRAMDPPTDAVRAALTDDDPARRRAAARYCLLDGPHLDGLPADELRLRLADPDASVRAVAARAFARAALGEHADPPADAFADLLAATEDPVAEVRGPASVAVARYAFDEGVGDPERAAEVVARGAFDADAGVRERVVGYAERHNLEEDLAHRLPDPAVDPLLDGLVAADAGSDVEAPGYVERILAYAGRGWPEVVEPRLDELVATGWRDEDRSAVARAAVAAYADGFEWTDDEEVERRRERLRGVLNEAGVDPGELL